MVARPHHLHPSHPTPPPPPPPPTRRLPGPRRLLQARPHHPHLQRRQRRHRQGRRRHRLCAAGGRGRGRDQVCARALAGAGGAQGGQWVVGGVWGTVDGKGQLCLTHTRTPSPPHPPSPLLPSLPPSPPSPQAYFRPELLNRLDEVVVFRQLSPAHVRQIADLELARTAARCAERGVGLEVRGARRVCGRVEGRGGGEEEGGACMHAKHALTPTPTPTLSGPQHPPAPLLSSHPLRSPLRSWPASWRRVTPRRWARASYAARSLAWWTTPSQRRCCGGR